MRVEAVSITAVDGSVTTLFEKRLSPRERGEPEALARLRGEADLLAVLGGRFTPRLVGTGEDERGPWLRTAPIPFPTLARRLEDVAMGGRQALQTSWIELALRGAFLALAELHEASDAHGPLLIVHADLSPTNIAFDDAATRAVLLDFDLASWRGSSTRDGAFRGTVGYCAPEIARGEPPTVASDLFALAATFLHAITGAAPRHGPSLPALLAIAAETPLLDELHLTPAELRARGPAHAALVRCLAHLPADRPASARAVLALF
jgi:serine/threonine protein kinase